MTAAAQGPTRHAVPHTSNAVTIDGRFAEGEWDAALRIEHPAGTVVHLQRDDTHLYVGITSTRPGFASLCVAQPSAVHIIHASAALDAISYRASGERWRTADTAFTWAMRNTALDAAAQAERAAYLREHGWVASTFRMNGRSQEIQLALDRFPLPTRIAMARWLSDDNRIERWPATLPASDGCATERLVQGWAVPELAFDTTGWVELVAGSP